mgnify:CR=1 FL=1
MIPPVYINTIPYLPSINFWFICSYWSIICSFGVYPLSTHSIGYAEIRELLRSVEMEVRPIPANSMEYIETVGELFQKYMLLFVLVDHLFFRRIPFIDALLGESDGRPGLFIAPVKVISAEKIDQLSQFIIYIGFLPGTAVGIVWRQEILRWMCLR